MKAKTVKATLNKPHTHARRDYPAGKRIDVAEHHVQWLVDQGVIDPPAGWAPAETHPNATDKES